MKLLNLCFRIILSTLLLLPSIKSASAFSIVPDQTATQKSFVPSVTYEAESGKTGIISRQPIAYASIARGGTEDFISALNAEYPASNGWKFIAAKEELQGSFSVSAYYVFFESKAVGGGFAFDYIPAGNDPKTSGDTELHWIQRVVSNHKRRSDHGTPENGISLRFSAASKNRMPFFDIVPKAARKNSPTSRSLPPHFEYDLARTDPDNDHSWKSETYLVSINRKDPKTVTIYNGVLWGWENKINVETPQAVH